MIDFHWMTADCGLRIADCGLLCWTLGAGCLVYWFVDGEFDRVGLCNQLADTRSGLVCERPVHSAPEHLPLGGPMAMGCALLHEPEYRRFLRAA